MITTTEADYRNAHHAQAIVCLLEQYACDPMGGGQAIDAERLQRLVPELARRPLPLSVNKGKKGSGHEWHFIQRKSYASLGLD